MGQGIQWENGVKLFSGKSRREIENEANEWFAENRTYIVKSINFVASRYSFTLVIHYQKPGKDWE